MWLLKWLINSLAIMLLAIIIPGVDIAGLWTALWLVVLLGLINVTLKPLLILLTLPINFLTLGLFTLVINAVLILFASSLLKGFSVDGFFTALIFSLILSVFNYIINILFKKRDVV